MRRPGLTFRDGVCCENCKHEQCKKEQGKEYNPTKVCEDWRFDDYFHDLQEDWDKYRRGE